MPLEIVAELDGDFGLERKFHSAFRDAFIRYEWFKPVPELLAIIGTINAGTFNPADLPASVSLSHFRSARNNSYLTEGWKYRRSVMARLQNIPGQWSEAYPLLMAATHGDISEAGVLKHRDAIEKVIADLRAKFGHRPVRRSRAEMAAARAKAAA
jgi:hypothetical protein